MDLLYFARRFQTPDGKTHFVRLAMHLADLDRELKLLYVALALVVLVGRFGRRIAELLLRPPQRAPVLELRDFASGLARGQLNRRCCCRAMARSATWPAR